MSEAKATKDALKQAKDELRTLGADQPTLKDLVWHSLAMCAKAMEKIGPDNRRALIGASDWNYIVPQVRTVTEFDQRMITVLGWLHGIRMKRKTRDICIALAIAQGQKYTAVRRLASNLTDRALMTIKDRVLRQIQESIAHASPIRANGASKADIEACCGALEDLTPLLQRRCGLYFLLKEGRLVYVGQSVNVASRLLQHEYYGVSGFDEVLFLPLQRAALDRAETAFILKFRPERNQTFEKRQRRSKFHHPKVARLDVDAVLAELTTG